MKAKTIRKNATKKISSLLNDAVGIIGCTSTSRMDDSFDSNHHLANAAEVIAWLANEENYSDARVYIDSDGNFCISGPYYFCDSFVAYFDDAAFQASAKWHGLLESKEEQDKPILADNIISLCDYRRRLAS